MAACFQVQIPTSVSHFLNDAHPTPFVLLLITNEIYIPMIEIALRQKAVKSCEVFHKDRHCAQKTIKTINDTRS